MSRLFLITLGFWSCIISVYSQHVSITGDSPNFYLKADQILLDGVRITETLPGQLSNFAPGDKVLIIQMTGVTIDSTINPAFKTTGSRTRKSLQNTGKFEVLQIDEIVTGADTIIYFTDNLTNAYDSWEKIQIIKVIEGETVSVNGTLRSKPWDGNVGGIIAILGIDTVRLEANSIIDVSNRGFRGAAAPVEIYPEGLCRFDISAVIKDTLYFRSHETGRSGNKGEGIITTNWPYTKGTGFNINGGGAGNGLFSGGGGGSNYFAGGDGGQESAFCNSALAVKGGWGGYACFELYTDPMRPKVIMGGGGGSGTYKGGTTPSKGGNGGGMVIIITGTVVAGNNASIRANGESASPGSVQGSGSGGGGGGAILIDAASYSGQQFNIQINGGDGTSTTLAAPYCNGAGGGGSGGIFWYSGNASPIVSIDSLNGAFGTTSCGPVYAAHNGTGGGKGLRLKNLIVPLTGFLFNSIRGTDTICEGQLPNIFTASKPKGGNGIYTWSWQQSTDKSSWANATGTATMLSFQPLPLNQTTYYRRIVNSVNPVTLADINDTSRVLEVFVYPSIANNSILGTDTICYNLKAKALNPGLSPLTGGNNTYTYAWQHSTDMVNWTTAGTGSSFDPGSLTETVFFRRIVNSAIYCSDTSTHVTVTVLPSISGNRFSVTDTSICENTSPGRIIPPVPGGGDNNYSYQWLFQTTGNPIEIPFTADSVMYTAGILTDTISYRRIVFSGNDNACIDTSNAKNIIVRPLISNNFISGDDIRYICYNSSALLTGTNPENGFGPGTYSYMWEESGDNLSWQPVSTATGRDLQSSNLNARKYYRRTVYSSPLLQECSDVSDAVEVRINPLPVGNVLNNFDTICAGSTLYVKFNVSGNGPFSVTVDGANTNENTKSNITGPIDSVVFTPATTQAFVMVSIQDDSSCLADPSGFVPVVAGTVYQVPEANAGSDFEICGSNATLQAVKTHPSFYGKWSGQDYDFANDTLPSSTVIVKDFGSNVFTWTETNWHCTDQDEVEIIFFEMPAQTDAGSDQLLDFVYQTELDADVPVVGTGKWSFISGSGTLDDDTKADALITGLSDQTSLKWTITNGICAPVSDSMNIVIKPLVIPKGYTPNDDNKNDIFDLRAKSAENIKIKVYNSAGMLVFEADDYCPEGTCPDKVSWNGYNQNGVELPEGTYFYDVRIKVAGKTEILQYRSFVEILR